MLAVANTVFQNHQHRDEFLSGEQIGEENLDLSREECGKLCNKEFHICNFRLTIKMNKLRNKER